MVLVGPSQPAEVHALAHWINGRLAAPVTVLPPLDAEATSLEALLDDIDGGGVDRPGRVRHQPGLQRAGRRPRRRALRAAPSPCITASLATRPAEVCAWHVPASHELESWGDLRAPDGTPSLVQPLMEPLHDTRTLTWLLAALAGRRTLAITSSPARPGTIAAAPTGSRRGGAAPCTTASCPARARRRSRSARRACPRSRASPEAPPLTLVLQPDPTLFDGSYANNAWLQECPKPLTKEVWGNTRRPEARGRQAARRIQRRPARRRLRRPRDRRAGRVQPGHAPGVLSLRSATGAPTPAVSARASARTPSRCAGGEDGCSRASRVRRTGGRGGTSTQKQFVIDGDREEIFPLYAAGTCPAPRARGAQAHPAAGARLHPRRRALGDGDRHRELHRLQRLRGRLPGGEQRAGDRPGGDRPQPRHALAAHRRLRAGGRGRPDGLPARALHALRDGALRAGLPRRRLHPRQRGPQRAGLQPLHRHPLLPGELPLQGAALQLLRLRRRAGLRQPRRAGRRRAQQPERHRARPRRHGEMHLLRPAHQRRPPRGGEGEPAAARRRRDDRLPERLPDPGHRLRRPQRSRSRVARLREEPQHFALLGKLNTLPRTTYLAEVRNPHPDLAKPTEPRG